ncbi:cellulase [Paenibacillus mucilaginosus 3016]|uniref:Cellulase n=1 Tax=Paenibacillus mucilaginosus 3016 TaxID=1116391 RepID=H6NRX8_9BACL|nr:cellulase family glycosylhydrolase [Paenibacillus mucilaginosus]AFC32864.1 cellulase [Paenibacillus mucilaginosus 3016]WFA21317.1 cellulase [Paenibacillus mucilaginosus]
MMSGTRFSRQLTALLLTLSIVFVFGVSHTQPVSASEVSPSQAYVLAMGKGLNVFNTFDSFRTDDFSLSDETSWGQPRVTQELILAAKAKGFKSIRIPMTAYTRYTLGADGHYVIDSAWLARYKEVVDWAVSAGLYVMINLHHDSWIWLRDWDGDTASEEYKRYVDFWTQLADYFKDEPDTVSFETINEPQFTSDTGSITKQDKLDRINEAAYQAIRQSGGNNATRMIIIPTIETNAAVEKANATYNFIAGLNDPNIIATVHYYSDWVFSGNLGRTGFDEQLYAGSTETPRSNTDLLFNTLNDTFISKGIGVVIGEYGWLSPDEGAAANQSGEKLKMLEYLNYMGSKYGVSTMIWPPAFDRVPPYDWNYLVGSTIKAAVQGQRSSYSTGLNEIYIKEMVASDIQIPLTLNGNTFKGIAGLKKSDYSYNAKTATLTLSKKFVDEKFTKGSHGIIADLELQFSAGAAWHQYIIKYAAPVFQTATGTTTSGITIPVTFNGSKIKRVSAFDASGNRIGPNSWFPYMQFGHEFNANYSEGTFTIQNNFFNSSVLDGTIKITIEFYDGQVINYAIQKSASNLTGIGKAP